MATVSQPGVSAAIRGRGLRWLAATPWLTAGALPGGLLAAVWLPLGAAGMELAACLAGAAALLHGGLAMQGSRAAAVALPALAVTSTMALAGGTAALDAGLLAIAYAAHGAAAVLLCTLAPLERSLHRLLNLWAGLSLTLALRLLWPD